MKSNTIIAINENEIESKIYFFRQLKVMLDTDLAELYGVNTKVLKQAVKRNLERFPPDFMFELNSEEYKILKSKRIFNKRGQHSKYSPYVFTEQGVAMLSSILNSERAIAVNIQIMRIFLRIRQLLFDSTEIKLAIQDLKKKTEVNSNNIEVVFQCIDDLLVKVENSSKSKQIGFVTSNK